MDNNNRKKFIDLSKKTDNTNNNNSSYATQYAESNSQIQFQNTNYNHSQPFQQNTNNPPVSDYNNTNNNYQQFPYQQPLNNYQQQNNYQQPQNYQRQYVDKPEKKTPVGMYIMLIAVIIFFAVIIVAMSTIMKAMVNKNNKDNDKDDLRGNITLSDSADDEKSEEETEEETEKETEEPVKTMPVVVEEVIEPVTEVVTVTVIVEVPAETEPPVIEQNYTRVYESGFYGYITTQKDPLNVRAEASKSAKVVTSIPKGTSVYVYNTSDSDWYYTTYNGKSGFVSADYVSVGEEIVLAEPVSYYGIVTTKKDPLNVREEPNSNSKILTTIPKGTEISFRNTNVNGWYWVSYNGKSGYVSSDYVTIGQEPVYQSYIPTTAVVATKQDVLNLRKSASMNGTIITGIPKGSTVTIVEYGDDWCYVSWGGYTGYVSTDYLSF